MHINVKPCKAAYSTLDGDCFLDGETGEGISLHCFSRRLFSWLTTMQKKYQNKHSHTQKAFYYNFVYCLSIRLWAGKSPGSTLQCLCPTVVPQLNAESPASLCVFWLHAPLSSSAMVVKRVPSLPLSSSTSSPSGFSCSRVLLSCCMLWLARSDTSTNTNT